MPLDPQAKAVIDAAARANIPPYSQLGAGEARRVYRGMCEQSAPAPLEVSLVENRSIPGPGGPLAIRHYRPHGIAAGATLPALVFFHGGGWVLGDLDTHDHVCRALAHHAQCAVVAVDYRLAPEHRFPAAVDDAIAAMHWVVGHGAELAIDTARIAVGGDSAGGNLAAVVTLAARDAGGPALAYQVLRYPVMDQNAQTDSYAKFGEGYLLTAENMLWFRDCYLGSPAEIDDWRASPLRAANLAGLPPACVITAGFDPLFDEGREYAEKLMAAGVAVHYECFEGQIHGFILRGGVIAAANHALYRAGQALRLGFALTAA